MGKQLANFITCTAAASRAHPNRARTHAVLVIGLYELLDETLRKKSFEDTKVVIRSRNSKDRQNNGQQKSTNNDV
jgi:hypothetical protein